MSDAILLSKVLYLWKINYSPVQISVFMRRHKFCFFSINKSSKSFALPVYNGPPVVICPAVRTLVAHFLYNLKWLTRLYFTKQTRFQGKVIPIFFACRKHLQQKYSKTSTEIWKHLAQKSATKSPHYSWCIFYNTCLVLTK